MQNRPLITALIIIKVDFKLFFFCRGHYILYEQRDGTDQNLTSPKRSKFPGEGQDHISFHFRFQFWTFWTISIVPLMMIWHAVKVTRHFQKGKKKKHLKW